MRRALLVLSIATCLVASGCWMAPAFDGARRSFNPDETTLNPSSIPSLHQLWSRTEGTTALPITDDVRVFVSLQASARQQNDVATIDTATGVEQWFRFLPGGVAGGVLLRTGGTLISTVANQSGMEAFYLNPTDGTVVDSETITKRGGFAPEITQGQGLSAFVGQEPNGPIEVTATALPFDHPPSPDNPVFKVTLPDSPLGSPTLPANILPAMSVSDNTFYVSGGNRVYAVDMPTACSTCVTWSSPALAGAVTSSPVIVNDHELAVTNSAGEIVFLDRADGHVLWTDPTTFNAELGSLAADDGQVYVMFKSGVVSGFSVDPCGQPTCNATHNYLPTGRPGGRFAGQVVVAGGLVYIANGITLDIIPIDCGFLNCRPIKTLTFNTGVTGLIVSAGRLIVTTFDGVMAFGP